jgi:hypothetical protein
MRALLPLTLALLLAACATPGTSSHPAVSEVREIKDLTLVTSALQESSKRTLLVLDIDDTLLTSEHFFGSDKWYEWQKTLDAHDPGKVPCLFDVIALNYEVGTQQPTQADAAHVINALQGDKLLLTSRNPLYLGGTLRTLHDNGFQLPTPLAGLQEGRSWTFRAHADAPPVRVIYEQGIFMTTGQNKGLVLLDLLQRLNLRYERVLLVDDGKKNIDNMQHALRDAGIDYLGLFYTRVDKHIGEPEAQAGRDSWQDWRKLLSTTYPQRLQALEQGQCSY